MPRGRYCRYVPCVSEVVGKNEIIKEQVFARILPVVSYKSSSHHGLSASISHCGHRGYEFCV